MNVILNDMDIKQYCTSPVFTATNGPMIEPFSEGVSGDGVISYGLSSSGYDIRLGKDIYCLKSSFGEVINPKRFKEAGYRERIMDHRVYNDGDMVIVPANGYVLGTSLERFNIPPHLMARCLGKSTLARCSICINVTPLEPGWRGQLTIEIGNSGPAPVGVFVGEGIAQIVFETLTARPLKSYADKNEGKPGKYMGQTGVTMPIVL